MKKPNRRRTHKYHASRRRFDQKRQEDRKDEGSFWADWTPKHNLGPFAVGRGTYKHNGETKFV